MLVFLCFVFLAGDLVNQVVSSNHGPRKTTLCDIVYVNVIKKLSHDPEAMHKLNLELESMFLPLFHLFIENYNRQIQFFSFLQITTDVR